MAEPLSSREISSRSSTSRSSRSTRSRMASPTWSWSSRLAAVFKPGQRRAQVVSDVRHEPPLALDPLPHRLGHPVDRLAELRDLVAAAGVDPRVELAGGHALGDRRRPPQPQREPSGQQQADQRASRRSRRGHLDHASGAGRAAPAAARCRSRARRSRRARPACAGPPRRRAGRSRCRCTTPAGPCAPRRAAAPAPTGRRPAAPSGAATAWSAGRSAPPTAPGPPPPPGPGRGDPAEVTSYTTTPTAAATRRGQERECERQPPPQRAHPLTSL